MPSKKEMTRKQIEEDEKEIGKNIPKAEKRSAPLRVSPQEMTREQVEKDEKEIGKNIPKEMIGLDTEDV